MCGIALVCLHAAAMLYRFGSIPNIPVFGDEIVINDPAIALSRGYGLKAPSFTDSIVGIDKVYAHFPPVYIFLQAAVFRFFGVSAYSLRLLTTVFSIASVIAFLVIAYRLYRRGVMKRRTAIFVSCLYALNAPVIILHRISRMESLIEFLGLVSLYCALKLTFPSERSDPAHRTGRSQIGLLVTAALASGIALAAHPEAITAILPVALIILSTSEVTRRRKSMFAALLMITPVAVWVGTYGRLWLAALGQMAFIAKNKAPDPSMPQFGIDLLRRASSSEHDLMLFLFFSLTLVVLAWALLQVVRAARAARAGTRTTDPSQRTVEKAVAIAVPVTVAILLFLLPASITRYEVFYPIYLLLIGLLPVPYTNHGALRAYLSAAVAMLIAGQFLACIQYVAHNRKSTASSAERYDSLLNCIPATAKVAASPQLWLAFVRRDRPFTLLYHGLDGLEAWKKTSADPLGRFDVILLTDYIQEDFDRYSGLSARGHVEQDVPIGPDLLHVYTRPGILTECNDIQPLR